jgi:hypothetical protein
MSVEQHLVGLQQIRPDQKGPAVRQLDVGNLQLGALTTQDRKILAPVKLECLTRTKRQGHKGAAAYRLLLSLPIVAPVTRKIRDPAVRSGKSENYQIGMQLLQRAPLLARLAGLRLQPSGQLVGERIELALPLRCRELRLDRARIQIFCNRIARQTSASRNLTDR